MVTSNTEKRKGKSNLQIFTEIDCGLLYPSHYKVWEGLAISSNRLLVQSARDHGKTTFFSILYPFYFCGNSPQANCCVISYSEDQAKNIVSKLKLIIDISKSEIIDCLKPKGDETWSKTEIEFANRSKIEAKSFGSPIRGGHYDLIVVDDPVKDFGGMSSDDQYNFYQGVISPSIKPDGKVIVVGTPVYDMDLLERLEKTGFYKFQKFPAIKDSKALWPYRFSLKRLDEKKKEIGETLFSREYLCERVNTMGSFFKSSWVRYYDFLPNKLEKVMSIDPAITTDGDYTAMVVTGTDEENKTYILETRNIRTDNVKEIVDTIFELAGKWEIEYSIIESIGFQRLLKHWIYEEMRNRNVWFGIEELKAYNKTKETRIMSLQPKLQSGSLLFGNDCQDIVGQLMSFPRSKYDDLIDALSMQVTYWGVPYKEKEDAPHGSWEWYADQIKTTSTYQQRLFEDMRPVKSASNIVFLNKS